MSSLGELVDKLSVVNIKMFMAQDLVHKAAAEGTGIDADAVRKLVSLNLQRNKLMTSIDRCLADAVSSGTAEVDEHVKIT